MFTKLDADSSNSLDMSEVMQVLIQDGEMSLHEAKEQAKMIFEEVDVNRDGKLTLKELEQWYINSALTQRWSC